MKENKQKLYIMDSNGIPIGYVFMGGSVLYSIDGKRMKDISQDTTVLELQAVLMKEKTWYIR